MMADKPIILKPHEVHGFLAGRQTQIRRVVKPQPPHPFSAEFPGSDFGLCPAVADGVTMYSQYDYERLPKHPAKWDLVGSVGVARDAGYPKQYYAPFAVGDRLVGKETWLRTPVGVAYAADGGDHYGAGGRLRWRSPVTMPRWASRITLTVKEVRCQRVQEISEADAIAEGVTSDSDGWRDYLMPCTQCCASARDSFSTLWKSIHGPDAWDRNDWVFAYTVEPALANIDKLEAA